ncbi:MAG TPA: histidine kinase dimerization/phospho-acceptor domain-containing protein, partial [Spirochaetia bacterium]|nr:histidine kinase dimerization/phospho-acceptor domain-containing protein [Spirochaetia bacterium]
MRLRTKLLTGILITLLLQIAVTGTFTLTSFLSGTRQSMEKDLRRDWDRARANVEELKHRLYTDIYQLRFALQSRPSADSGPSLQELVKYFISLTDADRIVLVDDPGTVVADVRAGIGQAADEFPLARLKASDFRFPRNQFMASPDQNGVVRLFLVTGATVGARAGALRHLYLVTDVEKSLAEANWESAGTEIAFFVGKTPIGSASALLPFETEGPLRGRAMRLGDHPSSVYSRLLSADLPDKLYLVTTRSLLAERLYIRSVLLTYLTAFLVTLAASLFLAAGITAPVISPFSRLSQWLHRYMDTGEVGHLAIHSRDEIGFLAGAFHEMVSTLIREKGIIADQLEQISLLHAYNERIMNGIPAAVVVIDAAGAIEFCNSYFAELLCTDFPSLRGQPFRGVLERCMTMRGGRLDGASLSLEGESVIEGLELARTGAPPLHFTAKISTIELSGSRRGSLIVLEDITAAERFWAGMTIADKVTSLGILSAGMAHEINNPLGSILSHVNYLKAVERERDKLDSLRWIESETQRIAALITRIRAYSAPSGSREARADLNEVAEETAGVVRFTLSRRHVSLVLDLGAGLPAVVCPPDELKQVVLN